jgi:hypothetical protein
VPSTTRILSRVTTALWIALCITLLTLWALSRGHTPAYARASGTHTWHAAVRDGTIWVTRISEWRDAAPAREAVRVNPAARPLIRVPQFNARHMELVQARQFLTAHAAQLRGHHGPADPEAAAEERAAVNLTTGFHEDLRRIAGGTPADPLVVYNYFGARRTWGVTIEESWVRAPLDYDDPGFAIAVGVPCWMVAVLLALWPMACTVRHLGRVYVARRRARRGCCPACGYDLRATADPRGPTLTRCPECGAASNASRPSRKADAAEVLR